MRSAIILVLVLFLLVFVASGFYSQLSYSRYRELIPKPRVVGPLTAIRASMRGMHDPNDADVADECLAHLKRSKIAALIAVTTWIVGVLSVVVARIFDLQRFLD